MATTNKVKGTAISMTAGITLGVLLSLMYTCILAAVIAGLVLRGKIEETALGYFVMGVLVTGAAMGSLLAAVRVKRRWMTVCLLTGAGFYLFLLIITTIFFGSNYHGLGVTGLLVLIGTLISGLLGLRRKGAKEKKYRKYHNC